MDVEKTNKRNFVIRPWAKTIKEAEKKHPKHFFRYNFVQKYTTNKKVLDAACGTGYGAALLGKKAKKVLAIDISSEAIQWANKYFQSPNIEFRQADLNSECFINDTEKFDVITSFETLEHLANPEKFLTILYKHIASGGTLILSVPNGQRELMKNYCNPYHIHHFDGLEFKKLVSVNFQRVSYYSCFYHRDWKHRFMKWLKSTKLVSTTHLLPNYYCLPGIFKKSKNWIAIATK